MVTVTIRRNSCRQTLIQTETCRHSTLDGRNTVDDFLGVPVKVLYKRFYRFLTRRSIWRRVMNLRVHCSAGSKRGSNPRCKYSSTS